MELDVNLIKDIIIKRIKKRLPLEYLESINIPKFYIAGNSLNIEKPNDIDIFPVNHADFLKIKSIFNKEKLQILTETKNAVTYSMNGNIIQLCKYYYSSLEELVESFDFAHIKIGAFIDFSCKNEIKTEVYFSKDWINSQILHNTWYTGSKYPLSSLIRLVKYAKRNNFINRSYITSIINILNDIIERGYYDYEDFKDQLDAVDLQLLKEEFNADSMTVLYSLLTRE